MVTPNVLINKLKSQNQRCQGDLATERSNNWLDQWQSGKLSTGSRVQSFLRAFLSLGVPDSVKKLKTIFLYFRSFVLSVLFALVHFKVTRKSLYLHKNKQPFSSPVLENILNSVLCFGQATLIFYFSGPLLTRLSYVYCFCQRMTCLEPCPMGK